MKIDPSTFSSEMHIKIDTDDRQISYDLMGNTTSLVRGATIKVPGNAMLTYDGLIGKKAFGFPLTLEFILTVTTGVSTGLVANWLYDKIKGRASTLRINRTEVHMSKGEIERIIIEQIEKDG
jgi:hypothetical protein